MPAGAAQVAPMRHKGLLVGHFFLAGKARGGEFTDEDEEILVLFAAQAAWRALNGATITTAKGSSGPTPGDAATPSGSLLRRKFIEVFEAPEPPDEIIELACPVRAGRFD